MIDKAFFIADLRIYYRDLALNLGALALAFAWGLSVAWPVVILPWMLGVVAMHRAGLLAHEVVHRKHATEMQRFNRIWTLLVGTFAMVPPLRFQVPHLAHHRPGIFGTSDDPQYPLVRSDPFAMISVLLIIPFVVPFSNLFLAVTGACGAFRFEERLDDLLRRRWGFSISMKMTADQQTEIARHSRLILAIFVICAFLFPRALPFYYAVMVGGWFLVTARIPLEHSLERLAESSGPRDQMIDSFTVESPLALLIQPVGFRFHTAHHMYPGVPYHNLPALHAELKRTNPEYRASIITLGQAIRGPRQQSA